MVASPTAQDVLATLERLGTGKNRDGMARYGIVAPKVFGVSVADLHKIARKIGRNHDLALELWKTGWYEARMLCAFIDEPAKVTMSQMDSWTRDFDNWAICDTLCFALWVRSPHAFQKIRLWSGRRGEYVKRAAFALLASVALRGKGSETKESDLLACLPLIEKGAMDERNFVKKGVSWALRGMGRRSPALHKASLALAKKLAAYEEPAPRWIGKDALRELTRIKPKGP
jgi:3-methyladenine DNA glycosylase AlkD